MIKRNIIYAFVLIVSIALFSCKPKPQAETNESLPLLKVSENGRFLQTENGDPFFWLGDTGWLLFSKLTREEANQYLDNRVQKGYNLIQVMMLHTLGVKNAYNDTALIDMNVSMPRVTEGNSFDDSLQYDYWDHVDYIVDLAGQKGLYIGLVPVWGSPVKDGKVTVEQAKIYAEWIANRYKDKSNVVWLNGGDIKGCDSIDVWNAIGETIDQIATNQLITFHPRGRSTSSIWFNDASWLDFNMFQSGHRRYDQDDSEWAFGEDNWRYVEHDFALDPKKPTIDGEPSYEGIPQGLHDTLQPLWTDADVRRYAYWSVFAGGFGFTYGHSAIMQFHKAEDVDASYGVKICWDAAMDAPGAGQMQYLKDLMLSYPFFSRVPDQTILAEGTQGEMHDRQVATRGEGYAMVYTYNGRDINIDMKKLPKFKALWFNPRIGEKNEIGEFDVANADVQSFDPEGEIQEGNDWVLVMEELQ